MTNAARQVRTRLRSLVDDYAHTAAWRSVYDTFRSEHNHSVPGCRHSRYHRWYWALEDLAVWVEKPQVASSRAMLSLWGDIGKLSDTDFYKCSDARHGNKSKRHRSSGGLTFQQWVLAENRWVPWEGKFFRPDETWKKLAGSSKDLLPKAPPALHSGPVAASDYSKPSLKAIEQGLTFLKEQHQSTGQGVAEVADELMSHLSRALRENNQNPQEPQFFLGHKAGKRVWVHHRRPPNRAIIWDLPIAIPQDLEEPVIHHSALDVPLIVDRYLAVRASKAFKFEPSFPDKRVDTRPLLTDDQRAQIWIEANRLIINENSKWKMHFKNLHWRSAPHLFLRRRGQETGYPCPLYMDLRKEHSVLWFDAALLQDQSPEGLTEQLLLLFPSPFRKDLATTLQTILSTSLERSMRFLDHHPNDLQEARRQLGVPVPVTDEDLDDDTEAESDIEPDTPALDDQPSTEDPQQPGPENGATSSDITTTATSSSMRRTTTSSRASGSTRRSPTGGTRRTQVRRDDGPDDRSKMAKVSEQLVRDLMADHFGATDVEDVSAQDNLGYDISCKIDGESHFVEVKSTKSTMQTFRLTQSEKEALEQFGDQVWVVFVTNVFEDQQGPRRVEIIRGLHHHVTSFLERPKPPDHEVARSTWELCDPEILEI